MRNIIAFLISITHTSTINSYKACNAFKPALLRRTGIRHTNPNTTLARTSWSTVARDSCKSSPTQNPSRPSSTTVAMRALNSSSSNTEFTTTTPMMFPSHISLVKESIRLRFSNDLTLPPKRNDDPDTDPKYNVIMGNEAGDADSIISALGLSYVKSLSAQQPNPPEMDTATSNNSNNEVHTPVPIVSILREDMPLRRDVVNLLTMAGINIEQDLLYLDDEIVQSTLLGGVHTNGNWDADATNHNSITLVDHNKLRSNLWHLEGTVAEIIDHHNDEGFHTTTTTTTTGTTTGSVPSSVPTPKREIAFLDRAALVGSTCTLVTERLKNFYEPHVHDDGLFVENEMTPDHTTRMVDPSIGLALLGVILLDTVNMCEEADKGTPRDEDAIRFLIECTDWNRLFGDDTTCPVASVTASSNSAESESSSLESVRKSIFGIGVDSGGRSNDGNNDIVPDRAMLYNHLRDSRSDKSFWREMSARDALRIDYKRFETSKLTKGDGSINSTTNGAFGLSSVLLPVSSIVAKHDFGNTAVRYMKETDVDLLGLLSFVMVSNDMGDGSEVLPSESPRREMLLIGRKEVVAEMVSYLLTDPSASFLEIAVEEEEARLLMSLDDGWDYKWLAQRNPKGSRKQVAPIIGDFFT